MNQPLISVGMPVYNCVTTVGAAIQSIINQSYKNWELILINDGSTDRTDMVCRSFSDPRIRYFPDGKNKGLHIRLNEAIDLGCGQYFARMDGDDISFPERFERQVDYLERHSDVDLLATQILVIKDDNQVLCMRGQEATHEQVCRFPWRPLPFPHPTWMGKLSWFRKYRYSDKANRVEDQEILLRAYRKSHFAVIGEPLLAYRNVDLSSSRASKSREGYSHVLLRQFFRSGNVMFLFSSLAYGLLSVDVVYHMVQWYRFCRKSDPEIPPEPILSKWAETVRELESSFWA